jgi:hypothetical protein
MFNPFFQSVFSQGARRASASEVDPGPELLTLDGVLALWRADYGVSQSSGRVRTWVDQKHGIILSASHDQAPALTSSFSALNNKAVLAFSQSLAGRWTHMFTRTFIPSTTGSLGPQDGYTCVVFATMNAPITTAATSNRQIIKWGGPSWPNEFALMTGWEGRSEHDQFQCIYRNSGSNAAGRLMADANPYGINKAYCIITHISHSTTAQTPVIETNGIVATKALTGTPLTRTGSIMEGEISVGNNFSGGTPAAGATPNMHIAEIIIFNTQITSASKQAIYEYGISRYGIVTGSM